MSSRVTRSAARLAGDVPPAAVNHPTSTVDSVPTPSNARKRKASAESDRHLELSVPLNTRARPSTQSKKQKTGLEPPASPKSFRSRQRGVNKHVHMAKPGPSTGNISNKEKSPPPAAEASSKRSSGRRKKAAPEVAENPQAIPKRSKKPLMKKSESVTASDPRDIDPNSHEDPQDPPADSDSGEGFDLRQAILAGHGIDTASHGDPFRGEFLGGPGRMPHHMSSALQRFTDLVSGVSTRLRDILERMKQNEDPSVQLIALQELSEILLVSNEDQLSGNFAPDQFVKELVSLMQPNEFGEENPEMMLLACRCIANLMEALPQATGNVVYGGAVPILCTKLLEIHFIDLAEQALSTLEKISVDFPSVIVREGGLTACLTYLDFFATSTQRVAVTTAANCCKNIPQDSFPVVRDVMPILLNVLSSSDQKVVEQGSICVSRVVESFKYQQEKLEELVSVDLLEAIRRLLQPGTTNLIGPNIHTQFLKVLSIVGHSSPKLSAALLKMSIVDTLYQILTGISPPNGSDSVTSQVDSVFIMQALIHRPREQVSETLNVICELLPEVQQNNLSLSHGSYDDSGADMTAPPRTSSSTSNRQRVELMKGCKEELKRFAIVLFPTLTDAFSSTVNLGVRQKVLTAQMKMLSNLDASILEDALRTVPYASYLASILSQEDHPSLVTAALQAADLLLTRLTPIYSYQFYREGVMAEVTNLANKPLAVSENKSKASKAEATNKSSQPEVESAPSSPQPDGADESDEKSDRDEEEDENNGDADEDDIDIDTDDNGPRIIREHDSPSPSESSSLDRQLATSLLSSDQDLNILRARNFLTVHESSSAKSVRQKAANILRDLQGLAASIKDCYLGTGNKDGAQLFARLAQSFCGDALDTITSSELLHSNVIDILLQVLDSEGEEFCSIARAKFLKVFMDSSSQSKLQGTASTAFGVFVHKLQDLLSRAEHFEVITVHHNALDNNRGSPGAMLNKQIRIRLVADEETDTPRLFKHQMIQIHAIATLKALDDYLRPRLSLQDRPKGSRTREGMDSALAAFAAAAGIPHPDHQLVERGGPPSDQTPSLPATPADAAASKQYRKTTRSKGITNASDVTPSKGSSKPTVTRKASRTKDPATAGALDTHAVESDQPQTPLECADEHQLIDDDDLDDSSALNAIVNNLDDGIESEEASEPTAVNMEIASTGKVTARKEDGTRIATPAQGPISSVVPRETRRAEIPATAGIPSTIAGRAMSYAAAIQATPQDWHIEFSVDGRTLGYDTTLYKACQYRDPRYNESSGRNIWSTVHTIKFKKVPGPPPPETPISSNSPSSQVVDIANLPASLHNHPATSRILRLLDIFHEMNTNAEDIILDGQEVSNVQAEPPSQFVNTKLTAKLNRQLEEPLIVASKGLPSWSEDLSRYYPFLFPFETRHLFLQSTSFGYSRSMTRWQNQSMEETRRDRHRDDRPFQGRLQRQKVRISRTRILESAQKVMELYGGSASVLEVEYFEEVGTGLGPTLEFYSTVSKEFSKKKIKMWRENDSAEDDEYAFGKLGLFPAPMTCEQAESDNGKRTLYHFKMLGKFVARSVLDSRIIDVSLNPTFFRLCELPNRINLSLGIVNTVDADLAKSLKQLKQYSTAKNDIESTPHMSEKEKSRLVRNITINGARVEDLCLDFTLPGYPAIDLVPNGSDTNVTIHNVNSYVDKVIDMTLRTGVQAQFEQFRTGFSEVIPYSALRAFTPQELVMLFGRVEEDWSLETLLDSIKADHGFNMDSKSVRNLLQVMSEFSLPQKREFLQFVTGSPKLPIGGFKALNPMFTVVCKPAEAPHGPDDFLVSVMTCANYLKLPDYTSVDVLRTRLLTAIQEGQGAFHLS